MPSDIDHQVALLERLTSKQLRARYAELFGEAVQTGSKVWLVKRLAWRLQALAQGDLSQRARQRAALLANDADLRLGPPMAKVPSPRTGQAKTLPQQPAPRDFRLPPAGSVLTRFYKGQTLQVQVLDQGFQFQGQTFSSLSALAKKITGSHCNGHLFFRLGQYGEQA